MGTLGTFDAFTTAKLGIYAAQHGLKVTGNNISNINTEGYTRQRIDQVSFKTGRNDRYKSMMDNHIGSGALVTGINQIRDPYLDIRYRNTTSDVEHLETKLKGLEEIASILDEVGKGQDSNSTEKGDGILYQQLQDLSEKLRAYSASPTKDNEILVRNSASALTSLFNKYADRLENLQKDYESDFGKNIDKANEILTNIQSLNKSIRECEINGDNALEMRDERNRQIDELSKLMKIKVEYSMEDVGAGIMVEKLTIYLGNANPDPNVESDSSMLVDGLYATQLSVPEQKPKINPYYASKDPKYAAIKDYMYLKEVDPANLPDGVNANQVAQITDEDGNPISVIGTNIVDEADKVDNKNYTIQLGKLLDTHGKEWKDTITTWTEVQGKETPTTATFEIPINGKNLKDGDTFYVNGKPYTVGAPDGISLNDAHDPDAFAAFVAPKLAAPTDYTISASTDGSGKLIYTATKQGAIGKGGPDAAPSLEVKDPDNTGWIAAGTMTCTDPGIKYDKPDPLDPPEGTTTDPVTGTEKTVIYSEIEGKWFRIVAETRHTREVALDDNDLYGKLQAQRELLTEEGEFSNKAVDVVVDENAMTKRGIPYYRKSFDLLAQKFAEAYNELNTGYALNQNGNYINEKGTELTIAGKPINKYKELDADQKAALAKAGLTLDQWLENSSKLPDGAVKMGGPLFSNSNDGDDTTGITASNIDLSHSWSTGAVQLVPKFEILFLDENGNKLPNTTQNINANHMVTMIDQALTYDPRDLAGYGDAEGPLLFTGSFNDMFSNLMGIQAEDARITSIKLTSSATTQVELDSSREGVSGVDLNDEAMNMMQYQKAMNAAMRLMTAIDEALDRLINNTGVAGR